MGGGTTSLSRPYERRMSSATEQAVALAEQEPLEVARANVPAGQRTVAAAVVEEGVHRRVRPHRVERVDHSFGATAGYEVLVGESEPHRWSMRWRNTRPTKSGSIRWRRQRRGSNASRQSHSKPSACTGAGGKRTRPAS